MRLVLQKCPKPIGLSYFCELSMHAIFQLPRLWLICISNKTQPTQESKTSWINMFLWVKPVCKIIASQVQGWIFFLFGRYTKAKLRSTFDKTGKDIRKIWQILNNILKFSGIFGNFCNILKQICNKKFSLIITPTSKKILI